MNRGAEELQRLLNKHGSKIVFALEVGVPAYVVSTWLSGKRKPNTKQRAQIEDRHGISWRLWDDDTSALAATADGPEAA